MQGWNKQWDEWVEAPGLQKFDAKLVGGGDEKEGEGGAGQKRKGGGGRKPGEKRRKVNDIVHQDLELPGEAGDPAVSASVTGNIWKNTQLLPKYLNSLLTHQQYTPTV